MAEGTPAVATEVGDTRETIESTGCPVIPINPEQNRDIADAAISLLSTPEKWSAVSYNMRKRAEEVHGRETYFDALTKLF